jgi:cytolysin (calcineurin-like family phosphatase)
MARRAPPIDTRSPMLRSKSRVGIWENSPTETAKLLLNHLAQIRGLQIQATQHESQGELAMSIITNLQTHVTRMDLGIGNIHDPRKVIWPNVRTSIGEAQVLRHQNCRQGQVPTVVCKGRLFGKPECLQVGDFCHAQEATFADFKLHFEQTFCGRRIAPVLVGFNSRTAVFNHCKNNNDFIELTLDRRKNEARIQIHLSHSLASLLVNGNVIVVNHSKKTRSHQHGRPCARKSGSLGRTPSLDPKSARRTPHWAPNP